MRVKVGRIVENAAKALSIEVDDFLQRMEAFTTPPNGRSEFSKTMTKDYRPPSDIRCTWQFASAVLDFLHTHRSEVHDGLIIKRIEDDCMKVLRDTKHRLRRYSYFTTDILPSSERVQNLVGAYAVIRQDTGDGRTRQELFVLARVGSGEKKSRLLATFMTPEIITRGVWFTWRSTLSFVGAGRRRNNSVSLVSMEFALPDDNLEVLGGILSGTSSIEGLPVILPAIAIKVPNAEYREEWLTLCDQSDASLRLAMEGCGIYKSEPPELKSILSGFMLHNSRILGARDLVIPLRQLGKPATSWILPGINKFVQKNLVAA